MSYNFSVRADLVIRMTEEGAWQVSVAGLRGISGAAEEAKTSMGGFERGTNASWYAARRLTYDLRAMSIGLMILKREFGGLNPVLDAGIQSLYVTSAAASVLIGTFGLMNDITRFAGKQFEKFGGVLGFLNADMALMNMTTKAGVYALGALIAIGVGTWVFEWVSGIASVRTEIGRLEKEINLLEREVRHLQVEQAALNAQNSQYAYWEAKITLEAERRGYITRAEAESLKYLAEAIKDANVENLRLSASAAQVNANISRGKDVAESAKESINDYYEFTRNTILAGITGQGRLPPPLMGPEPAWAATGITPIPPRAWPGGQLGGEIKAAGLIYAHPGEVLMQREQVADMLRLGGGMGMVAVSISLAGAHISGIGDLTTALREGGEAAGEQISRRLELVRRRSRSRY